MSAFGPVLYIKIFVQKGCILALSPEISNLPELRQQKCVKLLNLL